MRYWLVLAMSILGVFMGLSVFSPRSTACDAPQVALGTLDEADYTVQYVTVPGKSSHYIVQPLVSERLKLLPDLISASGQKVVAGINAGFFDPNNQLTTSYVVIDEKLAANPLENTRFVENPKLYPYLPAMLNRSEFRVLQCGDEIRYQVAEHRESPSFRCRVLHSLQAGPNLFEPQSIEKEAFVVLKEGRRIRDPIGVDRLNARSAIGITRHGDVVIAMVSMKKNGKKQSGVSLKGLADIMKSLGATHALALDGGSSSTFWYNGQAYYGKLNDALNSVQRPIKSALVVIKKEPATP